MSLREWTLGLAFMAVVAAGVGAIVFLVPRDSQSGEPVQGDPRRTGDVGMTSYGLPDSRLRVFERPFPQGGTQPLFSVVNVDTERAGSPWGCPE